MYFLFDIGGTNLRLAISMNGKEIAMRETFDRPSDIQEAAKIIEAFYKKNADEQALKGVAGGLAGALNKDNEVVMRSPNMKEWEGSAIKEMMRQIFKMPVFIENDADLAGLGEAVFGAGKAYRIVAYFTISTGVGGARVVNKKIDRGAQGLEPGHQIIFPDGLECSCKGKGHLEAYVSGGSVERRFHKRPYEIMDAAFWDELAKCLAIGIYNAITYWSPDIVVLGGSMMKQVGIPLKNVQTHLASFNQFFPQLPVVQKSAFGDESGLYGALALLNDEQ